MSKKKLLLYSIYYWPEVASVAQIYAELCESLVDEYDITVVCAVPCYTGKIADEYKTESVYYEEHNGIRIVRVSVPEYSKQDKMARVKNILAFYFNALKATKKLGPQDVVFTYSQPPVLGGMLGASGKKITGGKMIYGIQDFNPEQTMAVNYMGNALVHKAMLAMDKRSCRKADLVITVGRDMQETLLRRFDGTDIPRNTVINNWADEASVRPLGKTHPRVDAFKKENGLDGKFVIMYSGNIGLYYDLENLMPIFAEYKNAEDVVFAFVGEGAVKGKIEAYCRDNGFSNAVFVPYQAKEDLVYSLNAADVHLVTNAKGIKGVSVPSKIYGVMATNVPVFGILEEGSEAWRLIEDSGCGVCAKTGEYEGIRAALRQIIDDRKRFVADHSTGRGYLEKHLARSRAFHAYRQAIASVLGE